MINEDTQPLNIRKENPYAGHSDYHQYFLLKPFSTRRHLQMDTDFVKKEIKNLLKNYRKMDKKTRLRLNELGFEIVSDRNHYKITHPSSSNMIVTLGKTVSDYRAGRNTARYLCMLV